MWTSVVGVSGWFRTADAKKGFRAGEQAPRGESGASPTTDCGGASDPDLFQVHVLNAPPSVGEGFHP